MKVAELARKASGLAVIQAFDYLIPLLLVPFLLRVIGVHEYGRIAFSQAICAYFVLFVDYGFSYIAPRAAALSKEKNFVMVLFWEIQAAKLLLLLVAALVAILLIFFVPAVRDVGGLVVAGFLAVCGTVLFPIWYFQVLEKLKFAVGLTVLMRAISLGCMLVLVKGPSDTQLAAVILFAPNCMAGILFFLFSFYSSKLVWIGPKWSMILKRIHDGWDAFIASAASSAYRAANPIVLGLLGTPTDVAGYSVCEKIARVLQELNKPVAQVVFPRMSAYAATNVREAQSLLKRFLVYVIAVGIAGVAFVSIFSNQILKFFHIPAGDVGLALFILSFVPLIGGINAALGVNVLHAFGFGKIFSRFVLFAGGCWAIMVFPLIHFFSLNGAAFTYLACEIVLLICLMVFHFKKKILWA